MLYLTESAQKYLTQLLSKQKKGTQIRLSVKNLGTLKPQCNLNYFYPKTHCTSDDLIIKFNHFSIYLEKKIIPIIKETKIDILTDKLGTHVSLHSPYLNQFINNQKKTKEKIQHTSILEDRIQHVLKYQINPQLATHGGSVSLIKITTDSLAILQFHGGCNGCAMAAYTIKEGIEHTLKKIFPELKGIIDATKHRRGVHSFY